MTALCGGGVCVSSCSLELFCGEQLSNTFTWQTKGCQFTSSLRFKYPFRSRMTSWIKICQSEQAAVLTCCGKRLDESRVFLWRLVLYEGQAVMTRHLWKRKPTDMQPCLSCSYCGVVERGWEVSLARNPSESGASLCLQVRTVVCDYSQNGSS